MDTKIITTSNFPVNKKYYIYDFIDEITRIVFGYVYDSLGTNNAINAVQKAMKDFGELGITIKRLRTDNASEFTTTNWSKKNIQSKRKAFYNLSFEERNRSRNHTDSLTTIKWKDRVIPLTL